MTIVIKRNGTKEEFDWKKVERSIQLAADSAKVPMTSDELATIRFEVPNPCGVELILDSVIKELYAKGFPIVADSFMLHRERRRKERDIYQALVKSIADISVKSAKDVDLKRENANINGDTAMGQMLRIGSEAAKSYYLNYVIDPKFAEAHISGDIHIHDLDFYPMTTTCCQIDVGDLLTRGFDTGHGSIRSPKTIRTACNLACIIIQSNQNDQHGGQSIPNFDRMLAPFVDKTATHFYQKYIERDIADRKGFDNPDECPEVQDYRALVKEKGLALKYTDDSRIAPDELSTYQTVNGMDSDDWLVDFYRDKCLIVSKEELDRYSGRVMQSFQEDWDVARVRNNAYLNAVHDTEQDCMQGMEALVHNLNTMHCLPGKEKVWVFDGRDLTQKSVEELYNNNDEFDYQVLSVNRLTGKIELKPLVAVTKVGNRRTLVLIKTASGQELTTTDDHRYVCYQDGAFEDVEACKVANVLSPHGAFEDKDESLVNLDLATVYGIYLICGRIFENKFVCLIPKGGYLDKDICGIMERAFDGRARLVDKTLLPASTEYQFAMDVADIDDILKSCGEGLETWRVPTSVLLGNKQAKIAFFNGLIFSTGAATYTERGIASKSKEVINGARLVALSIGENPFVGLGDDSRWRIKLMSDAFKPETSKLATCKATEKYYGNSLDDYVYDLSVADNENFLTADGIFVHNSRAGAQVPFSSINFGTDVSPSGRLVAKCLLQAQENGLGQGETPIFPILIYRLKDGINVKEGDPNYDIFQQALRCSSKRMFPNFSFQDATFNKRYYDENKPETEIAYMGAVTGDNVILVKDGEDRKLLSFREAYNRYHGRTDIEIWDSFNAWVPVKKWFKYPDGGDWHEVTFEDWRVVTMTADHPLPTQRGRVECADLQVGDSVDLSSVCLAARKEDCREFDCLENAFNASFAERERFVADLIEDHCYMENGKVKALFEKVVALKMAAIVESVRCPVKIKRLDEKYNQFELTFLGYPKGTPINKLYRDAIDKSTESVASRVKVTKIEFKGKLDQERYDVETESDRFDVSGIYSHNCRTRVIGNVYDPSREIVYSRGNLSFTTINLPRLAYYFSQKYGQITEENCEEKLDLFLSDYLLPKLELVEKQLLERFALQSSRTVRNFPFLMKQGVWLDSEKLGENEKLEEVLKHGTLSIGFIGLAETLRLLVGKHHGESDFAEDIGLAIIRYMREYCDSAAQDNQLNFTLLATPSEGLCARVLRLDRQKFGVIPGYTDKEYITNSFHVPVEYETTFAHKIDVEAPYHELTNAGHISYIELDGDSIKNLKAFEKIVLYMKDKNMGYCAVNHPIDFDPACGFRGVIGDVCPKCGRSETEEEPFTRIRRITGYLVGGLDRFNDGKRDEERRRVKHGLTVSSKNTEE